MNNTTIDHTIAKCIYRAQLCSMAGKGITVPNRNCQYTGYSEKTQYVIKAIKHIRNNETNMFHYYVTGIVPDQNGNDSIIVYFDIRLTNQERYQISFHTPLNTLDGNILQKYSKTGRPTRWNKKMSSADVALDILQPYFKL